MILGTVTGHLYRGRAEKEPRISIPVLAVPVSELLAGKAREFVIL